MNWKNNNLKFGMLCRTNRLICLAAILCMATSVKAQIGIKVAQVRPMADFGANFKKAPSFELMYHSRYWNDRMLSRASFSYARFQPRQDTIPVYMVELTSPYKVFPGTLAFQPLEYFGLSIDNHVRIFEKNGFEVMAGVGISVMKATLIYDLHYRQQMDVSFSKKDWVAGLNASASALYSLNDHFSVFADLQYQYAIFTDRSSKFHNRKIGLGILFTIKNED